MRRPFASSFATDGPSLTARQARPDPSPAPPAHPDPARPERPVPPPAHPGTGTFPQPAWDHRSAADPTSLSRVIIPPDRQQTHPGACIRPARPPGRTPCPETVLRATPPTAPAARRPGSTPRHPAGPEMHAMYSRRAIPGLLARSTSPPAPRRSPDPQTMPPRRLPKPGVRPTHLDRPATCLNTTPCATG